MALSDEILADSPTIYLRLEETTGQHLDETANDNDSTTVTVTGQGTADPGAGWAGAELGDDFDGSDDHIVVPYSTDFYPGSVGSFTIFLVVKLDTIDSTFRRLVSWEDGTDGYSIHSQSASGRNLRFERFGGGNGKSVQWADAVIDTVYMVHAVYDDATDEMRLYVDNVLEDSLGSILEPMADTGLALNLGRRVSDATRFLDGQIYEFAFFKSALTTTRIAAHWDARDDAGASGVTGTATITEPVDVVAASGAVAVAGTAAITEPVDTVAGAGGVLVQASAAIAEPVDVVAASGSVASVGSAAITEPVDVAAASGAVEVSGTAAITEPVDVVAGSGAVAVSGSAVITEPVDVVAGSGTVAGGAITGTAAITEPVDIAAASGSVLVAGTGAIAEPVDVVSASGSTAINGSAAIDEPVDVVAASGAVAVSGTAAVAEPVDLIAGTGGVTITGTAGITEPVDIAAAVGAVIGDITGTAAIIEVVDAIVALGSTGKPVFRGSRPGSSRQPGGNGTHRPGVGGLVRPGSRRSD